MSSTSRSLVIGAQWGLPARLIEPFARSLRAADFRGRFVVLTGLCDEEEKSNLRALADAVVDVDPDYPPPPGHVLRLLRFLRSTRGARRAYPAAFEAAVRVGPERASFRRWSRFEYHLEGLMALRHLHSLRYLAALDFEPDFVMLTDLRDVFFQRDPFAEPPTRLELYLEDDSARIGDEAFNTRWIRNLYGEAELARLEGQQISCAGTLIGTYASVLAYLGQMVGEVVWRRRPLGSHDQGIHNGLLRRGRFPGATVVPNGSGRVLTLGKMGAYEVAPDGTVLNADGSVPAVLHQWDRHASLVERIEAAR